MRIMHVEAGRHLYGGALCERDGTQDAAAGRLVSGSDGLVGI